MAIRRRRRTKTNKASFGALQKLANSLQQLGFDDFRNRGWIIKKMENVWKETQINSNLISASRGTAVSWYINFQLDEKLTSAPWRGLVHELFHGNLLQSLVLDQLYYITQQYHAICGSRIWLWSREVDENEWSNLCSTFSIHRANRTQSSADEQILSA